MKTVLVVDNDKSTLHTISRQLQSYEDVSVLTAENGRDAVAILNDNEVDLIITDIQMPVMDGFSLLAHLSQHYPGIPAFIITAHGTPENISKSKKLGISHFFKKPLDMKHLTRKIIEQLDAGADGQIHCMSLPTFLQLVEMESKTCTLTITPHTQAEPGRLYFVEGELFAAETGNLENEEAAREIIGWEKASIFIANSCKKRVKQVSQPLMRILMENREGRESRTAEGARPEAEDSAAAPEPAGTCPPDAERIIEALNTDPGILQYGLYDDQDAQIPVAGTRSAPFGPVEPSRLFAPLHTPEHAQEKGVRYLLFFAKTGSQILAFEFGNIRAVIALQFGYPPRELIRKMNTLLAAPEPTNA
ncbi:MAG TPA: response regulator [Desulfosalsimonadaceae bacterium]|nr:response regulator [Desulfosalsimonadaceae bacterium]